MARKKADEIEKENVVVEVEKKTKKATKKVSKKSEEVKVEDVEEVKKTKTSDRSVLLRELKEKAKKLAEGIESVKSDDIKEILAEKRELLVSLEDYVKTGIHLGTKVITPDMKEYVYRRRADSIGVLNTAKIDDQIKKAIDFLSKYSPEEIILVCKRDAGRDPAKLFSDATGIKSYTKKYPGGLMTNTQIEDFYEPRIVIICDAWIDRNALKDSVQTNKKIIMLADTNNYIKKADIIIPCNNKASKSLGLIFWLLARGYMAKRKIEGNLPSMNTFIGDDGQEVRE